MLNICSSVQDPNQNTIHRGSDRTSQRAKEFLLKPKASEEMRLRKCVWRKRSWRHVIRSKVIRSKIIRSISSEPLHQKLNRVDKVQCTKCTTTNSAHASATTISATCLYIKTSITVIFLQTLFRLKWNGFEISSS